MLNKNLIIKMVKKAIPYLKFGLAVTFWVMIPFFYLIFFTSTEVSDAIFLNILLFFLILMIPIVNIVYMFLLVIIFILITTEKDVKEHPDLFIFANPFLEDDANK